MYGNGRVSVQLVVCYLLDLRVYISIPQEHPNSGDTPGDSDPETSDDSSLKPANTPSILVCPEEGRLSLLIMHRGDWISARFRVFLAWKISDAHLDQANPKTRRFSNIRVSHR